MNEIAVLILRVPLLSFDRETGLLVVMFSSLKLINLLVITYVGMSSSFFFLPILLFGALISTFVVLENVDFSL